MTHVYVSQIDAVFRCILDYCFTQQKVVSRALSLSLALSRSLALSLSRSLTGSSQEIETTVFDPAVFLSTHR